jgi:23S rRNA pseudouridine2605 synthase
MKERLHKVLASMGVATRRRAEEMIARGEVTVNGRVAQLGDSADPQHDRICLRGQLLTAVPDRVYIALNKPAGYVTSLRSTHGERTVSELLPAGTRVFPVGRLDRDTSGLLLLTNDGNWANVVMHPRYGVEKEYLALVEGHPSSEAIRRLRQGVVLPDGTRTSPARVEILSCADANTRLAIVVIEGKKRQIRQMARLVGHPVIELRRTRIGPIHLGRLEEGEWRHLHPNEVTSIRAYRKRSATPACR